MTSAEGLNPFQLDSRPPRIPLKEYTQREGRYHMLTQSYPERAERLMELAQADVNKRWEQYAAMAAGAKAGSNGQKAEIAKTREVV